MNKSKIDSEIFSLDKKRFHIKKKDFKDNLKLFFKNKKEKSFTRDEYDDWKGKACSSDTIVRHYGGSWEKALADVGIKSVKKDEYTINELLEHFEKVWRWTEQAPSIDDLKDYNLKFNTTVTYDAYSRRWGKYSSFIKIFSKYKLGELNKNEIANLINKNKNKRENISPSIRSKLLKEYNYKCKHCGKSPKDGVTLEIDHIKPLKKWGGKSDISNLQVLCNECNRGKSNKFIG